MMWKTSPVRIPEPRVRKNKAARDGVLSTGLRFYKGFRVGLINGNPCSLILNLHPIN